jgi:GNAT superfamily N-acetyltransferase
MGGRPTIDEPLRRLAEDPAAWLPAEPGEERIEDPRFVISLEPGSHPWSVGVQRLRLHPGDVGSAVAEIRAMLTERGRTVSMWSVGSSATPPDLADQLRALGMVPEDGPGEAAMVLIRPPEPIPPAPFVVRLAETVEEHGAAVDVMIESFDFEPSDAAEARTLAETWFERQRASGHTRLALVWENDVPIATGRVTFTPWGLFLGGGGTLPHARGRGAFSALIPVAWREAVRRGTPALVTWARRDTSEPILARLGFEEVAAIRLLRDDLDTSSRA